MKKNILLYIPNYPGKLDTKKWQEIADILQPVTESVNTATETTAQAQQTAAQKMTFLKTDPSEAFFAAIAVEQEKRGHTVFICTEPNLNADALNNFDGIISTLNSPDLPENDFQARWQLAFENGSINFSKSAEMEKAELQFSRALTGSQKPPAAPNTAALETVAPIFRIPSLTDAGKLQDIEVELKLLLHYQRINIRPLAYQIRMQINPETNREQLVNSYDWLAKESDKLFSRLYKLPVALWENSKTVLELQKLRQYSRNNASRQRARLMPTLPPMQETACPVSYVTAIDLSVGPKNRISSEPASKPEETKEFEPFSQFIEPANRHTEIFIIPELKKLNEQLDELMKRREEEGRPHRSKLLASHVSYPEAIVTAKNRLTGINIKALTELTQIQHALFDLQKNLPGWEIMSRKIQSFKHDIKKSIDRHQTKNTQAMNPEPEPPANTLSEQAGFSARQTSLFGETQVSRKRPAASATITSLAQAEQQKNPQPAKRPKLS